MNILKCLEIFYQIYDAWDITADIFLYTGKKTSIDINVFNISEINIAIKKVQINSTKKYCKTMTLKDIVYDYECNNGGVTIKNWSKSNLLSIATKEIKMCPFVIETDADYILDIWVLYQLLCSSPDFINIGQFYTPPVGHRDEIVGLEIIHFKDLKKQINLSKDNKN